MPIAAPHSPIHILTRRLGFRAVVSNFRAQAQDRFLWVPVFLAAGIAAYFALPVEPDTGTRIAVFATGFVGGLIWNGPMRAAFLLPMGVALWIWGQSPRPDILIATSARLVGVMDAAGLRVPSHARGEGFVVDLWLENNGDRATQPEVAARPLWQAKGRGRLPPSKGIVFGTDGARRPWRMPFLPVGQRML